MLLADCSVTLPHPFRRCCAVYDGTKATATFEQEKEWEKRARGGTWGTKTGGLNADGGPICDAAPSSICYTRSQVENCCRLRTSPSLPLPRLTNGVLLSGGPTAWQKNMPRLLQLQRTSPKTAPVEQHGPKRNPARLRGPPRRYSHSHHSHQRGRSPFAG